MSIIRLLLIILSTSLTGCAALLKMLEPPPTQSLTEIREIPTEADWLPTTPITAYDQKIDHIQELKSAALAQLFLSGVPQQHQNKLIHDPKLDIIAGVNALTYAQRGNFPATSLNQWLGWRYGVYEKGFGRRVSSIGSSYSNLTQIPGSDQMIDRQFIPAIQGWLGDVQLTDVPKAFGIAYVTTYGYKGPTSAIALVMVDRPVEITSFQRVLQPGETLNFKGTFHGYKKEPKLFIEVDDATVMVSELEIDEQNNFVVSVPAPEEPGEHFVEITYEKRDGWRTGAMLAPIYIGEEPPLSPSEFIKNPTPNPADIAGMQDYVLQQYNSLRQKHGSPDLKIGSSINTAATDGVTRYRNANPPSNQIAQSIRSQGVGLKDLILFKGGFEYLSESIWSQMHSPAYRSSILDPEWSSLGFGVVPDKHSFSYLTLLGSEVGTLNPDDEKKAILNELASKRASAKLPPYEVDPKMDSIVQNYAEKVCSGELSSRQIDPLWSALRSETPYLKGLTSSQYKTIYVEPGEVDKKLALSNKRFLSVGLCQGEMGGSTPEEFVIFIQAN